METLRPVEIKCPICKYENEFKVAECRFCNGTGKCYYVFGEVGIRKLELAAAEFKMDNK